jgi:hypothetical protein
MASTSPRYDDIVIERRFREDTTTHLVKQVFAVTYPGHTDLGTECESYPEAEHLAFTLAEKQGLTVWYEESSLSGKTLVKSFRVDS